MVILSKVIYTFSALTINIPMAYFKELEQIFQKFIWNQRPAIASTILQKKIKARGIKTPDIKLYYKTTVIKFIGFD